MRLVKESLSNQILKLSFKHENKISKGGRNYYRDTITRLCNIDLKQDSLEEQDNYNDSITLLDKLESIYTSMDSIELIDLSNKLEHYIASVSKKRAIASEEHINVYITKMNELKNKVDTLAYSKLKQNIKSI